MDSDRVKLGLCKIKEGFDLLSNGPADWYVDQLVAAYDMLMERFAPFKVKDRVALARTIDTTPDNMEGWRPYAHLLVKGNIGHVVSAECVGGRFSFYVRLLGEDGLFRLGEHDLEEARV